MEGKWWSGKMRPGSENSFKGQNTFASANPDPFAPVNKYTLEVKWKWIGYYPKVFGSVSVISRIWIVSIRIRPNTYADVILEGQKFLDIQQNQIRIRIFEFLVIDKGEG